MSPFEIDLLQLGTEYLFYTVRLETFGRDGSQGSGTAFFFELIEAGGRSGYLVTNRHVLKNVELLRIRFHVSASENRRRFTTGAAELLEVTDPESIWNCHPSMLVIAVKLPFQGGGSLVRRASSVLQSSHLRWQLLSGPGPQATTTFYPCGLS
jgi:hypothetical protein